MKKRAYSRRWPVTVAVAIGALALCPSHSTAAAELTAQQIVDKVLERNAFGFEEAVARLKLSLVSRRGSVRERAVEVRSMDAGGLNRTLVRFHAPADVAGTGFLVLERKDADDDQYLYLPALGKVKRISGSQRDQKFMGTDLTYADMESRSLRDAANQRLSDAKLSGNSVYVIESIPSAEAKSQYSKTVTWVHKKSFVPLKIEFYDKRGKLLKTLLVKRLEKKDGRWVAMDSWVQDVQRGSKTRMTIDAISFGIKMSDNDFTQQALAGG